MITYGGVNLCVSNPSVGAWVEANTSFAEVFEFSYRNHPSDSFYTPVTRINQDERANHIKLERLHWPRKASWWAHAHFLADEGMVTGLRNQAYQGSNPIQALPLIMSGNSTITTNLYMLPPRPLIQIPPVYPQGLYVITLVDDRYFWWWKTAVIQPDGSESWEDLFAEIGDALSLTLQVDPIAAEYLTPPPELMTSNDYIPPLLDSAAASVGMCVVRLLDGTVLVQSNTTSLANERQNLNSGFPILAGGLLRTS